MLEKTNTSNAPKAIGPYSQAVTVGNMIYTSGQIALDPETAEIVGETIKEQTHRVCKNLSALLKASGSSLKSVIKTVCYLSDMNNFSQFNEVYAEYFTDKPARSCVEVARLPKDVLVEIDVIAAREDT
ncbi:MAG: RidA family protein [Monoglobales bacterium]